MINYEEMKFDDYRKILHRRKWTLTILLVLGPVIGYLFSQILPKWYSSKSLVLIEQQQIPQNYVQSVVPGGLDQRVVQIMETVLSRQSLQAMITRFGVAKNQSNQVSMDGLVTELRKNIEVTATDPLESNGTDLENMRASDMRPGAVSAFNIKVTYRDASVAQQMCADITSHFIEENLRLREQSSVSTTNFVQRQLEEAKRKVDEQNQALAVFKSKHIGQLPDQEQMNMNILQTLNTQLDSETQALNRAQQDKTFVQSMLAQQIDNWRTEQSLNSPVTLQTELARQQIKLADLEARYSNNHPDVIAARKSLEELKRRVEEAKASASQPGGDKASALTEPAQIAQLRGQVYQAEQRVQQNTEEVKRIQEEIKLYRQRVQSTPVIEQQYKDLTRDHDTALKLYNDLLTKQTESQMASEMERRQEGERFRVINPASLPTDPSFPNPVLFTGGGFGGGLVLGIGLALFLETRDRTLRTEHEVEVHLQLPVLAHLPTVKAGDTKRGFSSRRHVA